MYIVSLTPKGTNTTSYEFMASGYNLNAGVLNEVSIPVEVAEMLDHTVTGINTGRITFVNGDAITTGSTFIGVGTGTNGWVTTVADANSRAVVATRG